MLCIVILNDSFDLWMCFDLLIWIFGWRLKYLQIAKNWSFYKFKDSMVTAPLEVMVFLLLVKLLLLISCLMPCDCIIIIMFTEQPLTWRTLRLTTLYRKQTGYQRTTTLDDKGNNSWHGRWMTQKESINHLTENWTDQIKKEKEKKKKKIINKKHTKQMVKIKYCTYLLMTEKNHHIEMTCTTIFWIHFPEILSRFYRHCTK